MSKSTALAPIEPSVLYPLADFQARTGLGRAALAEARKKGFSSRKLGNRKFILGQDFIDFLTVHGLRDNNLQD